MTDKKKLEKFYKTIASLDIVLANAMNQMIEDDDFDHKPFLPYLMIAGGNMNLCTQAFVLRGVLTKEEAERLQAEVDAGEFDDEFDDE